MLTEQTTLQLYKLFDRIKLGKDVDGGEVTKVMFVSMVGSIFEEQKRKGKKSIVQDCKMKQTDAS